MSLRKYYQGCGECNGLLFSLETAEGHWFAVCYHCKAQYELIPDGTIQLLSKRPQ
jgi:hypothetical protein